METNSDTHTGVPLDSMASMESLGYDAYRAETNACSTEYNACATKNCVCARQCYAWRAMPVDQSNPRMLSRIDHGIHAIHGIQCLHCRTQCLLAGENNMAPADCNAMQCNASAPEHDSCHLIACDPSFKHSPQIEEGRLPRPNRFRETPQMTPNPSTEVPRWSKELIKHGRKLIVHRTSWKIIEYQRILWTTIKKKLMGIIEIQQRSMGYHRIS